MIGLIVIGVVVLFVLLVGFKSIRLVPQARVVNVQRLGRYLKTAGAGPVFVIPFFDKILPTIDLREQVVPSELHNLASLGATFSASAQDNGRSAPPPRPASVDRTP
jgi:regulator of protease activity HflC (stomatin/prohibitin superfamily)